MIVDGYKNGKKFPFNALAIGGVLLEEKTAQAFYSMRTDAKKIGVVLRPRGKNSGFRSNETQTFWYNMSPEERKDAGIGPAVGRPGYSLHQSGVALDIDLRPIGALEWLRRNADKYGFKETVAGEPWHWEYSL